jgi:hypothetical protein
MGVAWYGAAQRGRQRRGKRRRLDGAGEHCAVAAAGGQRQGEPRDTNGGRFGGGAGEYKNGAHEGDEDDAGVEVDVLERELRESVGAQRQRDGRQQLHNVAAIVHDEGDLEVL